MLSHDEVYSHIGESMLAMDCDDNGCPLPDDGSTRGEDAELEFYLRLCTLMPSPQALAAISVRRSHRPLVAEAFREWNRDYHTAMRKLIALRKGCEAVEGADVSAPHKIFSEAVRWGLSERSAHAVVGFAADLVDGTISPDSVVVPVV